MMFMVAVISVVGVSTKMESSISTSYVVAQKHRRIATRSDTPAMRTIFLSESGNRDAMNESGVWITAVMILSSL